MSKTKMRIIVFFTWLSLAAGQLVLTDKERVSYEQFVRCHEAHTCFDTPADDDETLFEDVEASYSEGCDFTTCSQTFNSYGAPLVIDCQTASGELPSDLKLPPVFPGNYQLCETITEAHFCTIDTPVLALPLGRSGWPIGAIHLGKCIPKACSAKDLRKHFLRNADQVTNYATLLVPSISKKIFAQVIKYMLHNGTVVECVDDERAFSHDTGFYAFVLVSTCLISLVIISTIYEIVTLPSAAAAAAASAGQDESFQLDNQPTHALWRELLVCFSAYSNMSRLFGPVKSGDFLSLNGMRVLSMFWIIYGHTMIVSSGILTFAANPNINPNALDILLQSFTMVWLRAAEYSVDTFFFMSGFLATMGMTEYFENQHRFSLKNYLHGIVMRYVRLTPSYAYMLFFLTCCLSNLGKGPFWNAAVGRESLLVKNCRKYWWTNLLYINNFVPQTTLDTCADWTWYLGNDFMYFFLVFPLTYAYVYQRDRATGVIWVYGFLTLLIITQVVTTIYLLEHYHLHSSVDTNSKYQDEIYVKPYTRITPYLVGMLLAMYHNNAKRRFGDQWQVMLSNRHLVYVLFVGCFVVVVTIFVLLFDQYKCKAGKDCQVWFAFFLYGLFPSPNWTSRAWIDFYYGCTYLVYSLCLAFVCNALFCGYFPLVNYLLSHPVWTPLARLTYNAYLVHMMLMVAFYNTAPAHTYFSTPRFAMDSLAFIIVAYGTSFFLYLLVEKPVMNLSSLAFTESKLRSHVVQDADGSSSSPRKTPKEIDQENQQVTDVDSETIIITQATSPSKLGNQYYRTLT